MSPSVKAPASRTCQAPDCDEPILDAYRSDKEYCSDTCRSRARHRSLANARDDAKKARRDLEKALEKADEKVEAAEREAAETVAQARETIDEAADTLAEGAEAFRNNPKGKKIDKDEVASNLDAWSAKVRRTLNGLPDPADGQA